MYNNGKIISYLFNEVRKTFGDSPVDVDGVPMFFLEEMYPEVLKMDSLAKALRDETWSLLSLLHYEAENLAWAEDPQVFHEQNLFSQAKSDSPSTPILSILRDWTVETFRTKEEDGTAWGLEGKKFATDLAALLDAEDLGHYNKFGWSDYQSYGYAIIDHQFFQDELHPGVDWSYNMESGMIKVWERHLQLFILGLLISVDWEYETLKGEKISFVDMWFRLLEPYERMKQRTEAARKLGLHYQSGPYPFSSSSSSYDMLEEEYRGKDS